ncbi:tetratricopeptide repeat protein [Chitinibacter bivalviorum]|uniref:Tetratricopeptide repeat protein n=1 Tax=Chitinibacter bivalviorum TaxID=2739434 RepID=A0A7H9BJG0_9NEIS|nr:tetratricopeptide repeat protein [Chitinibacter bivalviorum]QLG88805.1 tetratricopeptide repeat protein [Chitinibacter bivalviorum]
MSLLLQALKKAEEEKRRREALAQAELAGASVDTLPESQQAENLDRVASAGDEARNDDKDESSQSLPPEAWVFDPLPDPVPDPAPPSASDIEPATLPPISQEQSAPPDRAAPGLSLADVEPLNFEQATVEPLQADELPASGLSSNPENLADVTADHASPESVAPPLPPPSSAPVARETVVQAVAPAAPAALNAGREAGRESVASPAQRLAASQILQSGTKKKTGKGLLPWIALGGAVLLFGLISWFAWQYQQLTNPSLAPLPAALPKDPVASLPQESASPLETELSHAPAGEYLPEVKPKKDVHEDTVAGISKSTESEVQSERVPSNIKPLAPKLTSTSPNTVKFEKTTLDTQAPLQQAWLAYQQDDVSQAERLYRKVLASEPRNRDALLGLAAVHVRRGQSAQAAGIYQYLLQLNPQDQAVQQAQMALNPEAISESSEARLLQDASQSKNPLLLGQYYANRQRWQEAQEQFFQAWSVHPDNADLAYNLAVSLDHLKQARLAADYYRKALDLANKRASSFDRAAAEARLAQLRLAGE